MVSEKSLGFGFGEFGLRKKVSASVSKNLVSKKISENLVSKRKKQNSKKETIPS